MEADYDFVALFARDQRQRNLNARTVEVRTGQLKKVREALGPFEDISRRQLERWLQDQQPNSKTRGSYMSTLSEFFKWGVRCNFFSEDPTDGLRRPTVVAARKQDVGDSDVAEVLAAATSPGLRCWLALMAYQGLRSGEVADLQKQMVDLQSRPPILKLEGDGSGRQRSAVLHAEVVNSLGSVDSTGRGTLFPGENAASISRKVGRHFKRSLGHGSSESLLRWYRTQVQDRGQNFDRQLSNQEELPLTPIERQLLNALDQQVPGVSQTYRQSIVDLNDPSRISFRGVATELRELIREVLDKLAPDEQVMSAQGFMLEQGLIKPSQKQKTRFILKGLGIGGSAKDAPETTANLIEDHVATFCRSLYVRSSNSLHADADRQEVRQIKLYVDALLAEDSGGSSVGGKLAIRARRSDC